MFVRYALLVLVIGIAGVYLLPRFSSFHQEGRVILNPYVEGTGAPAKPPSWLLMAGGILMIAGAAMLDRLRRPRTPPEPFVYYMPGADNTKPKEESDESEADSNNRDPAPLRN